MRLEPYVLWGQHRSTELLAVSIYTLLKKDPKLNVEFIEYKEYKVSDYVSVLKQLHKAGLKGGDVNALRKRLGAQEKEYNTSLRKTYGPFMFNLHDGSKNSFLKNDILILIPKFINEQETLKDYLITKAKKNNITISASCLDEKFNNDNLVVEFMLPESVPKSFESANIKELNNKYMHPGFTYAMKPDVQHPVFQETIIKYSSFMKEVLRNIHDLTLTEKED